MHYKVSNYYNPKSEITIKWNDKDLNIKWMINHRKISISKDKLGISFQQFQINYMKIIVTGGVMS